MTLPQAPRIVIVGATSAIARHCARILVRERFAEVILIGRDPHRLERVAADLTARSPGSTFQCMSADFLDAKAIDATIAAITAERPIDLALIAHGLLPEQEECQENLSVAREALEINGISPVLYAEALAARFARADHGTLVLIGSVAGDRGRKSNYVYGAAKGLVNRYAQGLQHRFAGTGVRVVLIKPGPTDTPMTARLKTAGQGAKLAPVEEVARQIVRAIERGAPVAYVPGKWRLIMLIIRHLPGFLFNRLDI
jgi:short-subunit dehydrogenase